MVDPTDRELRYDYDERALRLEQYEVALDVRYRFGYDSAGNRDEASDANGTLTTYVYDDNNRPTTITMANGPDSRVISHQYDAAGFRYRMDDEGVVTEYNISGGAYVPDPYGRINRETTTMGIETYTVSYTYNREGRATSVTSPGGHTSTYEYNALGELLRIPGFVDQSTTYNAQGRREHMQLTNGAEIYWEYDLNGRLTEKRDVAPSMIGASPTTTRTTSYGRTTPTTRTTM